MSHKLGSAVFVSFGILLCYSEVQAKEIALTFDDAPSSSTRLFESDSRTAALVEKLKTLKVPPVVVFANACNRSKTSGVVRQLKRYRDAGHWIGNHTCSHVRLDDVGFKAFTADAAKGEEYLAPLMSDPKYFRFPYLNEGSDPRVREQMRLWLQSNGYQNGLVSVDTDDYYFSDRVAQAMKLGKKVKFKKIEELFVSHVADAADYYDALAIRTLGRSPKHVLLLHERDVTVLFLEPLIKELQKRGWKLISARDAYQDPLYLEKPKNTYVGNGIIAQLAFEKTGERARFGGFSILRAELDGVLDRER